MNKVILLGRLTADPELKETQGGVKYCNICIAVDRRKAQDGTQRTDFIDCTAWDKRAEFIRKYFAKGQRICVMGAIQIDTYEKDGQKRKAVKVRIEQAEFADGKKDGQPPGDMQAMPDDTPLPWDNEKLPF